MTRVVVTGGAGFLGSHLCERLLGDGCEVVALDNFLTGTPANVAHLTENGDFRLIRADITDYVHVPGPVDAILHFASPASPIDYLQLPIETLKVGSTGTLHALGKLAGSSSEITFIPRPEDDPAIRQPDISLALQQLGWAPKVDLDEGLARTIAWFRGHPELIG